MDIGLADVENEGVVARQDVRERRREAGLVLSGYVDLDCPVLKKVYRKE